MADTAPDAENTNAAPEETAPTEGAYTIQHYIVAFMVFLCFIGQWFIWIKEMAIVPTVNPNGWSTMTLGSFSFMMFLSALVNFMSLRTAQPWLYVATVAVALSLVLDVNLCVTDWLIDFGVEQRGLPDHTTNKAWNWHLRTGYMLSLMGYIGSFLAMPVDGSKMGFDVAAIVGVFIGVWLIFGNIAIWRNEGGLKDGSFICPIKSHYKVESTESTWVPAVDTGLPVHVSRAFTTGILHLAASLYHWEGGQWMTFIIACVSVADYMPAGSGPGRCKYGDNKGCEAGVWLSFLGMWFIIISQIVLKAGAKMPDFAKINPLSGKRSLFGLLGLLMCLTGMCIVAAENHKKNDRNKMIRGMEVGQYEDKGAQEAYDVFQTSVGALFNLWGYMAANNRIGVAGLSLHFSVMNRLLGAGGPGKMLNFIGECPWKYGKLHEGIHKFVEDDTADAIVRAGYILLITGALFSVAALVDTDAKRNEIHKNVQIAAILVITCVTWLWSSEAWYGQMGYTALLAAVFHTFQYQSGLDAVYFWSCLQLASQTPFTSCEGKGTFKAFIVTIATFGLFYFAYVHLEVRGDAKGEPEDDLVTAADPTTPTAADEAGADNAAAAEAPVAEETMQK